MQEDKAIFEWEEYKTSPDVDQSCVFPSEDGYGEHNGCRRIVDWEETGIEDSKYRVNIHNFKQRKKSVFSLSAPLKLMMRDWRRFTAGVGVVKVVH